MDEDLWGDPTNEAMWKDDDGGKFYSSTQLTSQ
jgi:hypothetical protein